jgi:beta-N-acetylhexosaminidase
MTGKQAQNFMNKPTTWFACKTAAIFHILFVIFLFGCSDLPTNEKRACRWAEKKLSGLTLEKKVAQLICSDISGEYIPDDDPRMVSWFKLAGEYGIGGFVLYGGTPRNVANLLNRLQKQAEIPLLISSDFEGGAGQQVAGASEFPSNMAFAAIRDEDLMFRAAKIMAEEGRGMGIHLSYTPVTDVSVSPGNPQESVRSFGGDIDLTGRMLKATIKGYHEMGMLTTAKHFPGRGDMKALPDFPGFNTLDKPAGELEKNEWRAFQAAVDAGVDFIMTEHIAVPSVAGDSMLPASVEPRLVKGIIREKLGFRGIVTTDDLWYDHVVARFGAEEVAVMALEAGHDILLKPKNPVQTIQAVVDAVKRGRISEKQIDESVYKLLCRKAWLGLDKNRYVDEDEVGKSVGNSDHQKTVKEAADRSVTLLRNEELFPLKKWEPAKGVHIAVQKEELQPNVNILCQKLALAFNGISSFILGPGTAGCYHDTVLNAARQADLVILSFFTQRTRFGDPAPLREADLILLRDIIREKPSKVVAMSYGNPYILNKIENVPAFLVGYGEGGWYGNQQIYFDTFIRIMKNEIIPCGKLPVKINEDFPVGYGLTY